MTTRVSGHFGKLVS